MTPRVSRFCQFLFLAAVLASGCRTTKNRSSTASDAGEADALPDNSAECGAATPACGAEKQPVLCSVGSYDGKEIPIAIEPLVWGKSPCDGRANLMRDICARGLFPSKLGAIECAPDTTQHRCPVASDHCASAPAPASCSADRLTAGGANECLARANLASLACHHNQDPTLLQGISCHASPLAAECPPAGRICAGKVRNARCIAKRLAGKDLPEPMEAKAATACEAREKLALEACQRGELPSTLDDIVCTFE